LDGLFKPEKESQSEYMADALWVMALLALARTTSYPLGASIKITNFFLEMLVYRAGNQLGQFPSSFVSISKEKIWRILGYREV